MQNIDLNALYNDCSEFRDYVDRYAKNYQFGISISVEMALKHAIVREYAKWILRRY